MNSRNDRETEGFTAIDYLQYVTLLEAIETHAYSQAICYRTISKVLNHHDSFSAEEGWPISAFVTHLVYLKGSEVEVDEVAISVSSNSATNPFLNRSSTDLALATSEWASNASKSNHHSETTCSTQIS